MMGDTFIKNKNITPTLPCQGRAVEIVVENTTVYLDNEFVI